MTIYTDQYRQLNKIKKLPDLAEQFKKFAAYNKTREHEPIGVGQPESPLTRHNEREQYKHEQNY